MSTVLCHSHTSENPQSAVLAIAILSSGNVRLEYCILFFSYSDLHNKLRNYTLQQQLEMGISDNDK